MTMKYSKEELVKKLTEMLEDELEGIIEYDCVYNSMIDAGLMMEAREIEEIASEEYTHVRAIWRMLKNHGVDFAHYPKINEHWDKVKEIFDLE